LGKPDCEHADDARQRKKTNTIKFLTIIEMGFKKDAMNRDKAGRK